VARDVLLVADKSKDQILDEGNATKAIVALPIDRAILGQVWNTLSLSICHAGDLLPY